MDLGIETENKLNNKWNNGTMSSPLAQKLSAAELLLTADTGFITERDNYFQKIPIPAWNVLKFLSWQQYDQTRHRPAQSVRYFYNQQRRHPCCLEL
jgi:hypothetical protein